MKWIVILLMALGMLGMTSCASSGGGDSSEVSDDFDDSGDDDFEDEGDDSEDVADEDDEFSDEEDDEDFDEGDSEDVAEEDDEFTDEDDEFAEEDDELAEAEVDEGEEDGLEDEALAEEEPEEEAFEEPAEEQAVAEEEVPVEEEPFAEEEPATDQAALEDAPMNTAPATEEVTNLSFRAEEAGGTVAIETSGPVQYETRSKPETNQIIIDVVGAALPQRLTRPLITKDFPSEIGSVNAYQSPGSSTARIVIQMKSPVEPSIRQEGNSILISAGGPATTVAEEEFVEEEVGGEEVAEEFDATGGPDVEGQEPAFEEDFDVANSAVLKNKTLDEFLASNEKFYGRKISLEVGPSEVRDVLNFIAEQAGLNIIIDNKVEGQVSTKLKEIPWDQALVLILRSQKLGYDRQGSVLRIAPLEDLRQEAQLAIDKKLNERRSQPLATKVVYVSFAKADDLVNQIKPFLSERGRVAADKRTSQIIVSDLPNVVNRIEKLIKSLDLSPPQVLIEGKVVEATDNFARDVGVNWGFSGSPSEVGDNDGVPVNLTPTLNISPVGDAVAQQGLNLNVNFGTLDFFGDLSARLALFERESKVKIISSPRITALTNEKGSIKQVTEIPIISSTVDNGVVTRSVSFKPVELILDVTPQVTSDDSMVLDVSVTREFAGEIVDVETQARAINSREAKTRILVKNGQTAVIGGIYQSDATETEQGVPYLRKLPFLGKLFEAKSRTNSKNELLIFLTPRLIGRPIGSSAN